MYKTIVLHIDGGSQQDSRMRAAAMLAREHGAHLVGTAATGISYTDLALLAGSMAAPVPVTDLDGLRDAALVRLQEFAAQAVRLGVASSEVRLIEDHADYALLMQSRYADLVVLSQDREHGHELGLPARVRRLPEHLALHGARPVLVIPDSWQGEPIPGTVVAGWDGSMQAIRAFEAALPLLQRAPGVKLALINPDTLTGLHGEEPGADMALFLARHGVEVEVVVERTGATAGHALAALASDCGAGLIVSGAYGHSRYREWVLGGVTRELLARTPVPLLIAH
ncbi:universal stress protein [Massilia aerilata]|uniref:Universal stress protein n=1 Tax=Massilia aerilata TaxID=453817 RepID=A0ABW0RVR7_9BURK